MSSSNQRCAPPTKTGLAADVDRLLRKYSKPAELRSKPEALRSEIRNDIEELTRDLLESFPEIGEDRARAFAQKRLIPDKLGTETDE